MFKILSRGFAGEFNVSISQFRVSVRANLDTFVCFRHLQVEHLLTAFHTNVPRSLLQFAFVG